MSRAFAGIFFTILSGDAQGQSPDKKPEASRLEFEVASVKPAPPFENGRMRMGFRGGPGTPDPTRLTIDNYPMLLLIMRAYDVSPFQVTGSVQASERFTITAKVPEGATKEQFRQMLQNLLADRFKLKLHREIKELPIYELVVAKNGPKFKEHDGEPPKEDLNAPAGMRRDKDGRPTPPPNSWTMEISQSGTARGRHNAVAEAIEDFVKGLSRSFGRLVVDATGLKGRYDFLLEWTPELTGAESAVAAAREPVASAPDPDIRPTLMGAIQQQLGLKLESKKGPVEILVIESFNKVPTEN